MKYLVFILLLVCSSASAMEDGSVIFWHGGLLVGPIFRHTNSKITHVAIILNEQGQDMVYEATPPRVRRMPFNQYIQHLRELERKPFWRERGFRYFILEPKKPYTSWELQRMRKYARSQLGRPYGLRGWVLNKEVKTIFCSQYISNIIEKSGRIKSYNFKESPVSLYRKLR